MGIYNKIIIKFFWTNKTNNQNLKSMFLLIINTQDKKTAT